MAPFLKVRGLTMENIIIIVALTLFLYFLIVGQYISSLMFGIGIFGIYLIWAT